MNRQNIFKSVVVAAVVAIVGLLAVQVYWFRSAYDVREKQFNDKVNLALRALTNDLLKAEGDTTSTIRPVVMTASNSFYVDLNHTLSYAALDSSLRKTFVRHGLDAPFELTVYDKNRTGIILGNLYLNGAYTTDTATCRSRMAEARIPMDFMITFPDKQTDIVGGMMFWIVSACAFVFILALFAYLVVDLQKQKKLSEIKTDFMNNITHELQTPITNISLASEVLRAGSGRLDEQKAVHYANIIYQENRRLKFQVEQVLQASLFEKGEIALTKKEVNVNSLMEEVIQNFQMRIQNRQGQLRGKLDALQPFVFADEFHLTNIFYSLLDNADKYSPDKPDITVTTINKPHGILIAIADKGIGIRREVQQYIFDKFYRASTGNVHDVKGYGLGLTYVQKIVEAHRGRVSVTSEPQHGSCFELYFENC
ncbi:sensor histidine kinase [Chryseolinea lacunae]|uniref:histidine kinase n=1 Tax=Chryseolinea lacunae TaxID=2801331 RepID=A0ABS1KS46_9BACT|nr:HAMP domain-containing sensor histidine kinase [Chryseolinea lacunae]MBL0742082.1 HAMP domain-containing histidine kinase [Chryseolinea lacunae]